MIVHMSELQRKERTIEEVVQAYIRRWTFLECRKLGVPYAEPRRYWMNFRPGVWNGPGWGFDFCSDGNDLLIETEAGNVIVVGGNREEVTRT